MTKKTNRYSSLGLAISLLFFATFSNSADLQNALDAEYSKILNPLIQNKTIPGYYFSLYKNGEKIFELTDGLADESSNLKPGEKTLYAIASMTKPITTLAVLKLIENSELKLSDPIKKYLPDFSDMLVAKDGSYDSQLKPAIRDITLFDLLTHTSGLTYTSEVIGLGDIADTYRDLDIFTLESIIESDTGDLEKHTAKLAQLPLVAQPGEQFVYSVGIDVAGRIVEIVSGKSLREYLKTEILIPLEMNDTDFYVPEEKQDRLARLYSPLKRTYQIPGTPKMYQPTNLIPKEMKNFGMKTSMYSGGAGLISTAVDYSKFLNFLLDRKKENVLELSQASFDLILTDQLGSKLGSNLMVPAMGEFAKNQVFSLGLGVSLDNSDSDNKDNSYDYLYWSGAYSTHAWIDPRTGVYGIFMTQLFPLIMMTPDLEEVADRLVSK